MNDEYIMLLHSALLESLSIIFLLYRRSTIAPYLKVITYKFLRGSKVCRGKNLSKHSIFISMLGDIKDRVSGYYYIFISCFNHVIHYIVMEQNNIIPEK